MFFSEDDLKKIQSDHLTIVRKYEPLMIRFTHHPFVNQKAAEYAIHGLARRLKVLVRCIDRVFELLPPDLDEIPTDQQVADAVIYIQAFIFNIFGCMDNVAWIWVYEKNITRENGKPLPDSWVGIRKSNKIVRQSFSSDFQAYLQSRDDWFDFLDDFRHALAHRIPLYIPPYIIDTNDLSEHQRFDQLITGARLRADEQEVERLTVEQLKLGTFKPIMTHSFQEEAKHVIFHSQLLINFNTLDELGHKFFDELER